MIVDCFIFFNELDVLKVRLEELYDVVDRFVLVESDKTFRGQPKPYYFDENRERYSKYLDKIIHVKLVDTNDYGVDEHHEPWEREYWQRNQVMRGLGDCEPDDIVILSDVDEIPRRSTIQNISINRIANLDLVNFSYSINMRLGGFTTKVARFSAITSPQEARFAPTDEYIFDAGWHFSSLGDENHISHKLSSFSHWELDVPERNDPAKIKQRMLAGEDILGDGHKYERLEVDDTWPEEIKNNREYWRKYEL